MKGKPIINFSTKLNYSAIGIIRISFGNIKKKILYFFFKKFFYKKLIPKIINYLNFYNFKNFILDKGIGLYFNSPKSYTGEDLFEYHGHGNPYILNIILNYFLIFLKIYGLKISKKGCFTKKAFFNNKINIFELNFLLNLIKNNNSKFFFYNLNLNFNNNIFKILKFIEKIEIIFKFNFLNLKFKNKIFYYLKYIKKKIFFIINNICLKSNILKKIIILGFSNSGKSTFINSISKKYFSLTSNIFGTTKDLILKKIKIKNFNYKIFDSSGLNNNKDILEYTNIIIILKKLCSFNSILYLFDNIIYYNFFFYYIKKKIKKNILLIKIINKIDLLNFVSNLEYYIIKFIKIININISSKKKIGLYFFINEIKKKKFLNYNNFNIIFLNLIKKSYKFIIKSFLFFIKNKKNFFLIQIFKIKKILNLILKKKNKNIFNKIFKNFCLGK
ncbi:50S ribosome-binding GTPase [Candidatus Nasuia deltocephalinicola]|nr:50S ribosome-binding GTPase [Candidatus Nasuia deltocephalinicola]